MTTPKMEDFSIILCVCPDMSNSLQTHGLYSPPGSSFHGILQARLLEWVAISSSRGHSWPRGRTCVSCVAGGFFTTEPPGSPYSYITGYKMEFHQVPQILLHETKSTCKVLKDFTKSSWMPHSRLVIETMDNKWNEVAQLCLTLCDPRDCIAHQAPLSMGFSRQEYWSGLPCPPPGDLPDPGIKLRSLMSPAFPGGFFTTSAT